MTEDSSLVPAVRRSGAILTVLADAQGRPMSVSELSRQLGLPKSSTANLCIALEAERLITKVDAGFLLGRRLVELGGAYLATVDQVQEFYSACRRQPHVAGKTARVAVLEGTDVLYLARYDGTQPIRLTANIGDRFPAHCTATGKALLAQLDPAEARAIVLRTGMPAQTSRTITDPDRLLRELVRVRRRGYATDSGEQEVGVQCIAVPVLDAPARTAISISGPEARLTQPVVDRAVPLLQDVARRLSAELSYDDATA